MHSWGELQLASPDIAEFGRKRLDGKVAYLATVRESGGPRVHPVTAFLSPTRCFIFAEPDSSKVRDFTRNPQFHLHCAMSDSSGSSGEFQMSGQVIEASEASSRQEAEANCPFRPSSRSILYELKLLEAVATSYRGGRPDRRRWRAS
ncbi:MAG: pyridoxamine 5'-phosphate oxidase family protein [Pseudomonadales bacterium]